MVKVQPRNAGRFVDQPPPEAALILIYGPDRGQVAELAAKTIAAVTGDAADPFRVSELSQSAIQDDPAALFDEANALSLTGGRRVVRVRGGADALTKHLKEYLDEPSSSSVIVVEAAELQARSSLRKLAETDDRAAAIACYKDEGANLSNLVKEVLEASQASIAPDALRYVTSQLGADRQASRNALEKMALFAGQGGKIALEDARAVIGDVAESTLDELSQAVTNGETGKAQKLLQRLFGEGTATVPILRALARHFGRLAEARTMIDEGLDPETAVGKLRPPVFFRAKQPMVSAAERWNSARLANALDRLVRAEIDCKTTGMSAELMCARAVFALSMAAPRRR